MSDQQKPARLAGHPDPDLLAQAYPTMQRSPVMSDHEMKEGVRQLEAHRRLREMYPNSSMPNSDEDALMARVKAHAAALGRKW